jgi:hypothetical protein
VELGRDYREETCCGVRRKRWRVASCGEFGRWRGRGQDDLWLNLAAVLENSGS